MRIQSFSCFIVSSRALSTIFQKGSRSKSSATAVHVISSPVSEHKKYNQTLHQRTAFPVINKNNPGALNSIVLSFRFRSIEFSKKRALPFFLAIELLTHRKCVASLSSRNVQAWKVRKGRLVGCKVTLRREGLDDFIDLISLTFPRREKFQPPRGFFDKFFKKTFAKKANSLSKGIKDFKSFPSVALTLGELVLFYPIEFGLGLHADVQRVRVNFMFSTPSVEERFFLLRHAKVPVIA